MAIIHEAYLFRPNEFAREILPYAKALANSSDGEKLLLDAVIERFENTSSVPWLAMNYGGWPASYVYDAKYLYENLSEGQQRDRLDIGWLLVLMIYCHLHPVPSQLGLGRLWRLMEKVLRHPLGWHSSDASTLIHGHSFGYFAQLWVADELDTIDTTTGNYASKLGYWENVTTGSTIAQTGWLDYSDVRRFLARLTKEELTQPNMETLHDPTSISQVYHDTLQMLRSASEAECGLCIITSG